MARIWAKKIRENDLFRHSVGNRNSWSMTFLWTTTWLCLPRSPPSRFSCRRHFSYSLIPRLMSWIVQRRFHANALVWQLISGIESYPLVKASWPNRSDPRESVSIWSLHHEWNRMLRGQWPHHRGWMAVLNWGQCVNNFPRSSWLEVGLSSLYFSYLHCESLWIRVNFPIKMHHFSSLDLHYRSAKLNNPWWPKSVPILVYLLLIGTMCTSRLDAHNKYIYSFKMEGENSLNGEWKRGLPINVCVRAQSR